MSDTAGDITSESSPVADFDITSSTGIIDQSNDQTPRNATKAPNNQSDNQSINQSDAAWIFMYLVFGLIIFVTGVVLIKRLKNRHYHYQLANNHDTEMTDIEESNNQSNNQTNNQTINQSNNQSDHEIDIDSHAMFDQDELDALDHQSNKQSNKQSKQSKSRAPKIDGPIDHSFHRTNEVLSHNQSNNQSNNESINQSTNQSSLSDDDDSDVDIDAFTANESDEELDPEIQPARKKIATD